MKVLFLLPELLSGMFSKISILIGDQAVPVLVCIVLELQNGIVLLLLLSSSLLRDFEFRGCIEEPLLLF